MLLIVTLSAGLVIHPAHASSPQNSTFDATLLSDYVQVSLKLQVYQNLTQIESSFTLPSFNGILAGDNATNTASDFQTAIRSKAPAAVVSDLILQLASTSLQNTQYQWFNVSVQFRLSGIQTSQSGLQLVSMDWKSFDVPQNVTVGGVEVNNIGVAYLPGVAGKIASLERGASSGNLITYENIVNYFRVTPANLVSATNRVNLLNFTQLFPSVDSWQESYDYSPSSVTWSFGVNQILGLMITETPSEPQATPTTNGVIYTIQASVSAPSRSYVQGDAIVAVFNDNSELLMTTIIVVGVAVLAISLVLERRILNKTIKRKPKR